MIQSPDQSPAPDATGTRHGELSFLLLAAVVVTRVVLELTHLHQPIFEGYVGRQIPTAMVARDLATGGHFLRPQLQTGPFPSYFLVEPPVYATIVAFFHNATGISLEPCGRLVSLAGLGLTALATWHLCRNRWGQAAANLAAAMLLAMPVTLRYGRAFQPDMLALGLVFTALAMEDRATNSISSKFRFHFLFYMLAMATKVTLAPLLIARIGLNFHENKPIHFRTMLQFMIENIIMLLPALGWYLWQKNGGTISSGGQSADGLAYWLKMIGPMALFSAEALKTILPNLAWKAWTPLGLALIPALIMQVRTFPFLKYLSLANLCWLLLVGAKAHHAYYWLVPTPVIAICAALFLNSVTNTRLRTYGIILFIITGMIQARSTWHTPPEWQPLTADLQPVRDLLQQDPAHHLIAHEAAIYAVNRPGLRWELSPLAQQRAASAWNAGTLTGNAPTALFDFYTSRGGRWFLALETDPDWPAGQKLLSARLRQDQVVYRKAGLILYDLKSHEPRAGKP